MESNRSSIYLQQYSNIFNKILSSSSLYAEAQQALESRSFKHKNRNVKFQYLIHGSSSQKNHKNKMKNLSYQTHHNSRLVFGLHGGGGCPKQVNDQQYNNHKHLYDGMFPPSQTPTIWCVIRSPENASDMWWKPYIPEILQKLTQYFFIMGMIDLNKVFVTGYSAGGDGIYHLGGMMADRLAGAAMMAGHPNKARIQNLRNLTYSIHVGGNDNAYDRGNWGRVYIEKLDLYGKEYGGFVHYSNCHKGVGHWMNKKQVQMFGQLFSAVRNPYPNYLLFVQHERIFKETFYYLKVEKKHKGVICVEYHDNRFRVQTEDLDTLITLRINRVFVDFDREIEIFVNDKLMVKARPKVNQGLVAKTFKESLDPYLSFEDEFICAADRPVVKERHPFRPRELEGQRSYRDQILEREMNVIQDEKLFVKVIGNNKNRGGDLRENKKRSFEQRGQIQGREQESIKDTMKKIKKEVKEKVEDCVIF